LLAGLQSDPIAWMGRVEAALPIVEGHTTNGQEGGWNHDSHDHERPMNEIGECNRTSFVRIGGRHGSPLVFAQLEREWAVVASDMMAFRSLRAWAVAVPGLDGFASLAELVATVSHMGDPDRSCRLLANLLVIADGDDLAARAVLQAIVPGLRQAAKRRWLWQTGGGPWGSADDIAAEAVSAGWAAIRLRAGQRHDRPAAVIVRAVEGHLRQTHAAWRREAARGAALPPGREPSQSGEDAARSVEAQAAALITGAVRAGVLNQMDARLVFVTGVLGSSVADAARAMRLEGDGVYRSLARARGALRAWLGDSADDDVADGLMAEWKSWPRRSAPFPSAAVSRAAADVPLNAGSARSESSEDASMPPLLLTPLEAARLLGISRSKVYALMQTGEIDWVTIGACRRIPHGDLVDYVKRLPRRRLQGGRHVS
jgi:excisionase family DNA binding protein